MKRLFILLALILIFVVSSFGAEDWIFKVPVKLKNICEDYTSFRVYCIVYIGANYTATNEVGGGWAGVYTSVTQYKGDVDRVVTVKAYRHPGKNPALGSHYKCHLSGKWQGNNTAGTTFEEVKQINPDCVYKPGTVFTPTYHGTLQ